MHHARPRLTDPARVIGAKPARFARFVFELLGATAGDQLVDLFPGSGGIGRAWQLYTSPDVARDASPGPAVDVSLEYSGDRSSLPADLDASHHAAATDPSSCAGAAGGGEVRAAGAAPVTTWSPRLLS